MAMSPDGDPRVAQYTPEEEALWEQINEAVQWPDGPVPMLPVAQLYTRDVPSLRPPGQAGVDLLQVLWCPFDHPPENYMPRTALFWRSAATVTDILVSPPEPLLVEFEGYVPEACLLAPEQVTEYPSFLELTKELREQLGDWSRWMAAGPGVDGSYAAHPESFYGGHLSVAPGWKVGGWPGWGYTDPVPRLCPVCGIEMDPLLTIATFEWDAGNCSWIPNEDQAAAPPVGHHYRDTRQPTAVQIGSGYKQQLYTCPAEPEHPHTELMQ
ncbi:hypothetical protein [Streptomyces sp. Pv4-95]|uniref:hypothetical protein n=1 Tax=Streptomyces sp. Pv4-95 TaxID=3049543 RepID=UPI003891C12B